MNSLHDVGVVGVWYLGNYGSVLNGYSTFEILKSFGLKPLNILTPYNNLENHTSIFVNNIYKKNDISIPDTFNNLEIYNKICKTVISGSDQIWHYEPNNDEKFHEYFRLNFIKDEIRKISFSTSMGNFIKEPESINKRYTKLYKRYNAISVREYEAVQIMKNNYGIETSSLIDPCLCIPLTTWNNLADYSKYHESEQYLLAYILDPTEEKRETIKFYANKLGMKCINILDGVSKRYNINKKTLSLEHTLPLVSAFDFLKYFANSYFVISDSYHGACFSIIFNKPFIAISNKIRGVNRFETLFNKLNIKDRFVSDINIPKDERYLYHMDFCCINKMLEKNIDTTKKWLKDSLNVDINTTVSIIKRHVNTILNSELCTGCGSCISSCSQNAIYFTTDKYGSYRAAVDEQLCIDCNICTDHCPAIELPKNLNSSNPISYAFISSDKKILRNSSSGGAFSTLSKKILTDGGYVVGAAWNSDFSVKHIIIESKESLHKLQKSKYLQSYMGNIMLDIKQLLKNGKKVLFVGTPCQVSGLKKYLNNSYNNIILVDLLCAQCPSKNIFQSYINDNFDKNSIESYHFRYKDESDKIWNCDKSMLYFNNDTSKILNKIDDLYLKIYHDLKLVIPSHCLRCKYQGTTRFGDITIGDCWGVDRFDSTIDPSKGVSAILANNDKGKSFLDSIDKSDIQLMKEIPLQQLKKYNTCAFSENRNWTAIKERAIFNDELYNKGFNSAINKLISLDYKF